MAQIFQNMTAIPATNIPGQACAGNSFTPTAGDVRYFRITVTPSSTLTADTLSPDILVDSVPQAVVAQNLQGIERGQILQVNTAGGISLTQPNLESLFSGSAYSNLQTILAGNFLRTDSSGATLPSYASTPTGVSIGDMWYDSVTNEIKYQTNLGTQTVGAMGSVSGNSITSGTISGSTSINTTGNLVTTGNVTGSTFVATTVSGSTVQGTTISGSTVQATNLRVYNGALYVQLTAQAMSSSYSLALPPADGISGQVMATNGTGILSWITPSSGVAGTISVGQGGTNATSFAANRMIASNGTGTALQAVSCSLNQVLSFDVSGNYGCYNLNAIAGSSLIANGGNTTGAAISIGTNDNYGLSFITNNTTAMTISTNGNIGIGTTSPSTALHVAGTLTVGETGTGAVKVGTGNTTTANSTVAIGIGNSAGSNTNSTAIGHSNNSASGGVSVGWSNTTTESDAIAFGSLNTASAVGASAFGTGVTNSIANSLMIGASNTAKLTILSSGNVGIGTSAPGTALDVSGAYTARGMSAAAVPAVSSSNQGRIYFDYATNKFKVSENGGAYQNLVSSGTGDIRNGGNSTGQDISIGTNDSNALNFKTNNSLAMTISQGGNVGIGTSSPSSSLKLQVSGAAGNVKNIVASGGAVDGLVKKSVYRT